jgi:hypothetical protein
MIIGPLAKLAVAIPRPQTVASVADTNILFFI